MLTHLRPRHHLWFFFFSLLHHSLPPKTINVKSPTLQHSFRTDNLPFLADYLLERVPQGQGQRLDGRLGPMMIIHAPKHIHMQGQAGRLAEALEAVREHLGRERADPLVREAEVGHAEGPRGDVDDGTREGFVEGRVGGAEAAESRAGAERRADGRAECEKGVFCRVVVVDCVECQMGSLC